MNMARVAAGGRNWEASGGDPYLAGEASVEMVKGIQSQGVIANAKHFVANEVGNAPHPQPSLTELTKLLRAARARKK